MTGRPAYLLDGYLGSQPKFAELGLSTSSHHNPEFAHQTDGELEIKFGCPNQIKVTSSLLYCPGKTEEEEQDKSDHVFTQYKDGVISFILQFPAAGFYKFQVYTLAATDEAKSLPNAYNYLIDVKHVTSLCAPYPKQYATWKGSCYLFTPLKLNSSASLYNVEFKVQVPNAKATAVVAASEWVHLTKKGDCWEGSARLDMHRGKNVKVTLNANFIGQEETKYATLLEYVI